MWAFLVLKIFFYFMGVCICLVRPDLIRSDPTVTFWTKMLVVKKDHRTIHMRSPESRLMDSNKLLINVMNYLGKLCMYYITSILVWVNK